MAEPEEEPARKDPQDPIRYTRGGTPVTWDEIRETAVVVKDKVASLLDDQVKDMLGMSARRVRLGVSGLLEGLSGEEPVTACKVVKSDNTVCGRATPCRYHPKEDN
jgi:hypothetical protein